MVARIRSGKSLKGAVNYNEHKVKEGNAEMIMAKGYPKHMDKLNFHDKVNRLQKLADLNTRTETNCLHVSLNFDVAEQLSNEKLQQIADTYMEKIGFANQPYLVYEHRDAAHQHIHIVTTNIQKDGKRISLHNLGRIQSEKARKEIEINFMLVKVGDKQQKEMRPLKPVNLEKAVYGKVETKRAIANIVTSVISQYKFTSFAELNAVLRQFNVIADRGAEKSRMFEKKGLQYCLLDKRGQKIGIPVKASSLHGKPTLVVLEKKYLTNEEDRNSSKEAVKSAIKIALHQSTSQSTFTQNLNAYKIDPVYRTNSDGFIYGITYVDHQTRTVFNGSDLGKEFSAAGIRQSWATEPREEPAKTKGSQSVTIQPTVTKHTEMDSLEKPSLLDALTGSESTFNFLPYQLKKKRKRKQNKRRL